MSKHTLYTIAHDGQLVNETTLELKEGSILILKLPPNISCQEAELCHNKFVEAINCEPKVITLTSGFELQVLKIK